MGAAVEVKCCHISGRVCRAAGLFGGSGGSCGPAVSKAAPVQRTSSADRAPSGRQQRAIDTYHTDPAADRRCRAGSGT